MTALLEHIDVFNGILQIQIQLIKPAVNKQFSNDGWFHVIEVPGYLSHVAQLHARLATVCQNPAGSTCTLNFLMEAAVSVLVAAPLSYMEW